MPQVKMPLDEYNQFLNFIGIDWLQKECENFQRTGYYKHPFILSHLEMLNYNGQLNALIPKEIYYNMTLKNYLKFSFLGSIIKNLNISNYPRLQSLKKDLQNSEKFNSTIFEILTLGLLVKNNYKVEKISEKANIGNPDFVIKNNDGKYDFTVECTERKIPQIINDQEKSAKELSNLIEEFIESKKINCRIYISTKYSYNDVKYHLYSLIKNIIDDKNTGKTEYCNGNVKIFFEISSYLYNEECEISNYLKKYPLLSNFPSNLQYIIISETNLAKMRNISEVALNYDFTKKDINYYICSTAEKKIDISSQGRSLKNKQFINGIAHYIFVGIPDNLNQLYKVDYSKIKKILLPRLQLSRNINSIVFINETFGQDKENLSTIRINPYIIVNPNAKNKHKIVLSDFPEEKVYTVTNESNQIYK